MHHWGRTTHDANLQMPHQCAETVTNATTELKKREIPLERKKGKSHLERSAPATRMAALFCSAKLQMPRQKEVRKSVMMLPKFDNIALINKEISKEAKQIMGVQN